MRKILIQCTTVIITFILLLHSGSNTVAAIFDPLSKPNNMFGMHVLFDHELQATAELVNSNGGEWGYVTIPIQMGDYNLEKWQRFMNQAQDHKVIPIVRLMTDPYWANTHVWRKPKTEDIIDMANFLNSLQWPIENRYVIVFNETNRYDEWGGEYPNPEEYVDILETTIDIFKQRNENFYMIMGGLDNAAPDDGSRHMGSFTYLERMARHNERAFQKMDGFSSHSYPNPGFSQPPSADKRMGTATYKYEYEFIKEIAGEAKPAFITETGWDSRVVDDAKIAEYYTQTFKEIWEKDSDKIVAVTPFLLRSHGGFDQFAFLIGDEKTKQYESFFNLKKIAGKPTIEVAKGGGLPVLATVKGIQAQKVSTTPSPVNMTDSLKEYFRIILGI